MYLSGLPLTLGFFTTANNSVLPRAAFSVQLVSPGSEEPSRQDQGGKSTCYCCLLVALSLIPALRAATSSNPSQISVLSELSFAVQELNREVWQRQPALVKMASAFVPLTPSGFILCMAAPIPFATLQLRSLSLLQCTISLHC